jgi:uncharacterized protein (TIGR02271 family)
MDKTSAKIQNSEFEEKLKNASSKPVQNNEINKANSAKKSDVLPVIEEQIQIDKKVIQTGSVYIYKDVHEEEVTVDVPYSHDEIEIKRVPVNQFSEGTPPPIRYEGDNMIIPVLKEVLVVEKRIMIVEEVHVQKRKIEHQETQKITLRKEGVTINREDHKK